jgi:hypothetical protein
MSGSKPQHGDTAMLGLFSVPGQSVYEYPLVHSSEWPAIKKFNKMFSYHTQVQITRLKIIFKFKTICFTFKRILNNNNMHDHMLL